MTTPRKCRVPGNWIPAPLTADLSVAGKRGPSEGAWGKLRVGKIVLTVPERLRLHTRFDRQPLGQICTRVGTCIQAKARRLLGRDDVVPGRVAEIRTFGEFLHWHPHLHALLTCGAFTPEGEWEAVCRRADRAEQARSKPGPEGYTQET